MVILALTLTATGALTETHQRDIACVVEIAVLADEQKRGVAGGAVVQAAGKRWAGIVGGRIMAETGQPRELVSFAMTEAAKARAARTDNTAPSGCINQMNSELSAIDSANAPLPKPVRAQ